MQKRVFLNSLLLAAAPLACSGGDAGTTTATTASGTDTLTTSASATDTGSTSATTTSASESDSGTSMSASATASATDSGTTTGPTTTDTGPKFDVGGGSDVDSGGTGVVPPSCKVVDDMDAVGNCDDKAPPGSFEPDVQWAFMGQDGETQAVVTPVVGNLTDDNDDGEIDLCDVPDVVAVLYPGGNFLGYEGHIYILDGATGAVHVKIPELVAAITYPALADVDGDGVPEILSATITGGGLGNSDGYLTAWKADGTVLWTGDTLYQVQHSAIAVADVDNDGDAEIFHHGTMSDHEGKMLWQVAAGSDYVPTMADLDGDDDMEVILGGTAYHHDGSPYFSHAITGHPQVADLDGDGEPEVLVVAQGGLALIEHDGTLTYQNQVGAQAQWRPAAIHDVDGDDVPEICVGSSNQYSVLELDLTAKWTNAVLDSSGYAAGTAFDFLGDGSAEAMYADETTLFIYEGVDGTTQLTSPRGSWTQWENPIVADVDNDGSAEIVVVSNLGYSMSTAPAVQVIRDQEDRWIQARRIWNQHTYHVTNVREDGTIPTVEPKHWKQLNTFRTQAQIGAGGGVCKPDPEG